LAGIDDGLDDLVDFGTSKSQQAFPLEKGLDGVRIKGEFNSGDEVAGAEFSMFSAQKPTTLNERREGFVDLASAHQALKGGDQPCSGGNKGLWFFCHAVEEFDLGQDRRAGSTNFLKGPFAQNPEPRVCGVKDA
jgi:hypothetical protein